MIRHGNHATVFSQKDYDHTGSQKQEVTSVLKFRTKLWGRCFPSSAPPSVRPGLDVLDQVRLLVRDSVYGRIPRGWPPSWDERHFAAMRLHGVAPWIYFFLKNRTDLETPEEILAPLRKEYHQTVLQSMYHEACIRRLAAAFARERIPLILLKGGYLGLFVYKNLAVRPMCDIDILIPERDLIRVQELLRNMDYEVAIDLPQAFKPHLCPSRPYVRRGIMAENLDLHSALWAMDHYRLSSETIWQNSVEVELFGERGRVLTAEMNLIHSAIHMLGHPSHLRDYLDLMMVLTRLQPNWKRVLELGEVLGVLRPLYWVAMELNRNWECATPPEIMDSLRGYQPSSIEDLVIRSRFRYFWRIVSRVKSQEGLRNKYEFLRLRMFPPPEYRKAVLGTRDPIRYVKSKFGYFLGLYKRH